MKRQTEPQPIERPVLHRKGRTDEAAQNPSDLARPSCAPARLDEAARHPLARPKLRPASQIAIWMSIDIISAAELRLIALGEPPPVINRCELRQLPWHGKGRASLQRPRQVEPHRLTYAARCGTESVQRWKPAVSLQRLSKARHAVAIIHNKLPDGTLSEKTMKRNLIGMLLIAVALAGACDKKDIPVFISQEDKQLLEQIKAKEKAKSDLQEVPSKFIETGSWKRFDKGIINDYTRATAIEFTNNSQFDVSDISGKITYIDANGQDMATVPFRAHGEVRAGSKVELEVTAGEISGAASTGRIVVEKVRIRG